MNKENVIRIWTIGNHDLISELDKDIIQQNVYHIATTVTKCNSQNILLDF